jgi:hypothetical protein
MPWNSRRGGEDVEEGRGKSEIRKKSEILQKETKRRGGEQGTGRAGSAAMKMQKTIQDVIEGI